MNIKESKAEKIEKKEVNNIWVSNEILFWESPGAGGKIVEKEERERAYKIWNHANQLIEEAKDEFHLSDGIIDLKRALNHRLMKIEEYYGFKRNIPEYKKIPYLEILDKIEIIRPLLLKTLLQVRNGIEHNDNEPPEKERCQELSDAVWLFLKVTDPILAFQYQVAEYILYNEEGEETPYFIGVRVEYEKEFQMDIRGNVPTKMLAMEERENMIEIELEENISIEAMTQSEEVSIHGKIKKFKEKEQILKRLFGTY